MSLKNRFKLFIFSLILLLVSIAVMGTVGVLQTRTHIQAAISMDELVVDLYVLRILDGEYVAAPSERIRQQWMTVHDQIGSKLAQQRGIPSEVAEAFTGLEEIFGRLAALPEAQPGKDASQRRLRNQIAMSLNLESQRVIDWASEISRQTKSSIVPHLMRIGGALLVVVLIVAGATITIMLRTARRVLSSITKLKDGAEAIAGGTLGFQVVIVGSDEIATLGNAINRMSRDLMDSYEKLQVSENQFRSYVEDAPIGVFICDETGHYQEVNPAASTITGYTREELLAVSIPDILPPESHEAAALAFQEVAGMGRTSAEFAFRRKDGRVGVWSMEGVRLSPTRFMGMVTDVTERKRADEERNKLQAQFEQSQKMESLGTLAGGVAHDMNNVLGAILGLASAQIGTQPYGSPLHKALDTICKATERGGKMVKSLLSFARQTPAENHELDLNAILREQVGLLERTTLAKVRLKMDLEAELRPILGDASALTHAFMNLCVNAVDAMPENGTLTLHTRNVDNNWIEVMVEDTGTGMPKEVLEKAMDPFFTTKGVGKGTGLGLSMVFSTVKAHRGQMAIESEPGKGTRVMLRFPACEQEAPVQVAVPTVADDTRTSHGSLKVLVVDDDDLIQSSVQMILEVLGHTAVTTAPSGEEALAILEAGFEPDLVILDMNMPGMGGAGTLPRLRALRPAVPVLLSTGRADQTALTLASAHPGVALLSKPFGLRELQKHLESVGQR